MGIAAVTAKSASRFARQADDVAVVDALVEMDDTSTDVMDMNEDANDMGMEYMDTASENYDDDDDDDHDDDHDDYEKPDRPDRPDNGTDGDWWMNDKPMDDKPMYDKPMDGDWWMEDEYPYASSSSTIGLSAATFILFMAN